MSANGALRNAPPKPLEHFAGQPDILPACMGSMLGLKVSDNRLLVLVTPRW
jgi:hypothetical protein